MFNSGFKGIRAVDGSGIVTLKDVEVQQTSLQPKITSWAYTNGAYVPYPDTAIVGGETIVIYGSGFQNGANVYIGSTAITSTRLDQNRITFTAPSQSAGSYVLYVINPNGNAAVYAPGIYYNSYPVWNTTSYANTFVTPTSSVSFNLNATDSANLTFTLQSGSLPTGLTLYSSGLISGTTTVANTTVYTFTAVATDSFNQAAQASIIYTITYLISDPYFNSTTLLLNGETNTNTYIQDTSNNNFALTVSGAATPNRFSPLWGNGYYGNYFGGSSGLTDYITVASSTVFSIAGVPAMFEFWFYPTASNIANSNDTIFQSYTYPNGYRLDWNGTSLTFYTVNGGTATCPFASGTYLNIWTFIQIKYTGTTITFYINGAQVGTANQTVTITNVGTSSPFIFGVLPAYYTVRGYISNFRLSNVSTRTIAVPTAPFVSDGNTSLLTFQSSMFVDNSPNALAITPSGTVKVVSNQPFATVPSTATITTNNAGYYSGYFDGSTGYIPIAQAFNQATTTTPFTWELWFFTNVVNATNGTLLSSYFNGGANHILYNLYISSAGVYNFRYYTGSAWVGTNSTTTYTPAAWNHIAAVYNGTVCTLYLNGTSVGSVTTSWIGTNGASQTNIGASYDNTMAFAGYISNVRFVNGTAVYTANFTPPTSPLTAITNTALLTCQNSTYIDNSTNSFAITPTGKTQPSTYQPFTAVTTSTAVTPANYGAGLFDGSTGYLTVPANSAFTLGTNNHTIEFWMYLAGAQSAYATQWYYSSGVTQQATNNYYFQAGSAGGGAFSLLLGSGGAWGVNINAGSTPYTQALNNWTHVAITRSGSTFRLFANGIQVGSATYSGSISAQGGGMLIGTDGSNYATGYISNFRIVNGTALYTSNFIPPTTPLTAIANTALLTLQNKNGANNNVFYDDSVNNFPITRTGTPTQGTFSPFSQTGWSNYLNGTSYITLPSGSTSSINNNNNFTLEFFTYITGYQSTYNSFFGGSSADLTFAYSSNGSWGIYVAPIGSGPIIQTGMSYLTFNQWLHIALVRNGSAWAIYVNGVQAATATSAQSFTNSTKSIGSEAGSNPMLGYISNFRYTNSVVYTSTFTPPTTPLTAIANTSLLTCQSNRFLDNSTNNFSITVTGTAQVQAFSPFAPGVTYNPATNGGSMWFGGSTNALTVANQPISTTANTFTVEAWIYPTATPTGTIPAVVGDNGSNYSNWSFGPTSSNTLQFYWYTTTGVTATGNTTILLNTWTHIAVSVNSGAISLYVNGIAQTITGTSTLSNRGTAGSTLAIGSFFSGSYAFTGYISNLRVVAGTALYTSNFTPPTSPPTPTANTTLLLLGTNTGIQDATGKNDIITVGSAKTQSNTVKYGTGAMQFSSTNYLTLLATPLVSAFGSGSFTVEAWIYPTQSGIFTLASSNYNYSSGTGNWSFYFSPGSASLLYFNTTSVNHASSTTTTISLNTWTHIAYSRNGSTAYFFVNGTQVGTTVSDTTNYPSGGLLYIGQQNDGTGSATGYIDDLRITNGVARYTANFTPPTADLLQ